MSTLLEDAGETEAPTASIGAGVMAPRRLDRGVCVGRFVILDRVGEGGMGVVYKAYDPDLERAVALKFLHVTTGDSQPSSGRRERLLREAKALARLSHPNVLAVYDVGTFDSDVFLATEFVEGTTLSSWLHDEKRSRAELLRAVLASGDGLAAAHRAGLVHRDFKPANVIVGKDGRVRVLDFGLARAESAESASLREIALASPLDSVSASPRPQGRSAHPTDVTKREGASSLSAARTREPTIQELPSSISSPVSSRSQDSPSSGLLDMTITEFGQILGTPRFMAPEQHLGRTADARSDQFSFCVTLYEALYGEFPFEGRGEEYAANVTQGRIRNPTPGSDVPRWLRAILLRGLSVAPGDRFASMDQILAELRRDPHAKRNRWAAIAGAALLVVGVTVGVRSARRAEEAPCRGAEKKLVGVWDDARKRAVHDAFVATGSATAEDTYARVAGALDSYAHGWVAMHTDACEATRVRGEQSADLLDLRVECLNERLEELRAQVDVLAHADSSALGKAVQAVRALPRFDACADAAALRAPIRPPADAAARARVDAVRVEIAQAKALQRAGSYEAAKAIATKATDEAAALAYRPVEAEALFELGDLQDDEGDYTLAEHTLRRSAAAAIAGGHEAQAARSLTAIVAEVGLREAHFESAHEWALLAQAEVDRSNDPFVKGELPRNVARVFTREGKYEDARANAEKCLAIWEPALGEDDYAIAGALTDLGNTFFSEGRYPEAITRYERSLAIQEKALGPTSPSLGPNLNNLGEVYNKLGDYDRATQSLSRARSVWEGALGPDHPKVALATENLATTRRLQGDADAALDLAKHALAIWQKALGDEHPDVALGLFGVAEGLRMKGEYVEALAMHERALAMRERILGPKHSDVAESLVAVGETRLDEGHGELATAPLERALSLMDADTVDAVTLGDARFDLARALAKADPARSLAEARRARESYEAVAGMGSRAKARLADIDAWIAKAK